MRVVGGDDLPELPSSADAAVVTVGTFDGVHCGHRDVLARLTRRAADTRRASLLVTFEPHPLEVLSPDAAPALLTTREEKLDLLEDGKLADAERNQVQRILSATGWNKRRAAQILGISRPRLDRLSEKSDSTQPPPN